MKSKDIKTQAQLIEKLQHLAGIKPINESEEKSTVLGNLEFSQKGVDGKTYGIVKENAFFFIKTSTAQKEKLNESDFVYIGGLANKNKYKYSSLGDASKNLNYFMITLNESYVREAAPEEEEATAQTPATEVPAVEPTQEPVAEPSAEAQPTAEPTPAASDDELEEDPIHEIQSMVGKLTQKVRNTELTPEMTKSILNSVVASLNLNSVEEEDRLAIAKRIKKGEGATKTSSEVAPEAEPTSEVPAAEVANVNETKEEEEGLKTEDVQRIKTLISKAIKSNKSAEHIIAEPKENEMDNADVETNAIQTKSTKLGLKNSAPKESEPFEEKAKVVSEDIKRIEKLIDEVIKGKK